MKQGLLLWSHCNSLPPISFPSLSLSIPPFKHAPKTVIFASLESTEAQRRELSARERRLLRNERRESRAAYNWREEVEERLIRKPKKRYTSWTEELNLDNLAQVGPQWWIVRVSRVRGQETAETLARTLARNFPDIEFKVYTPAVHEKKVLKNGSITIKPKPIFPGCVFFYCTLNKEIHDFVRECDGVGGFVGSKVGNKKRQINKPRPVSSDDMEAIFRQAKEEQVKADQAFEDMQQEEATVKVGKHDSADSSDAAQLLFEAAPKLRSRQVSDRVANRTKVAKRLIKGTTVQVVSGPFAEYAGTLKKVDRKAGKATVGVTLFGKESLVELDVGEIVVDT